MPLSPELIPQHADDPFTVLRQHRGAVPARNRVEAKQLVVVAEGQVVAAQQRNRFRAGHRVDDFEDPVDVGLRRGRIVI